MKSLRVTHTRLRATIKTSVIVGALLIAQTVHAISINPNRCENLIQTTEHADGRNAWASRCLNDKNVKGDQLAITLALLPTLNQQATVQNTKHWYLSVYADNGESQILPVMADDNCQDPWPTHRNVGACLAGCFAGDQQILTNEGYLRIDDLEDGETPKIVTLASSSTVNHLEFTLKDISQLVRSLYSGAKENLVVLETRDGGKIVVTREHMLLDGEGVMREAASFEEGDRLIRVSGERVKIVRRTEEEHIGRVYHVTPETLDDKENVLVAQGFLSGSHRWQVREKLNLDRLVFRGSL